MLFNEYVRGAFESTSVAVTELLITAASSATVNDDACITGASFTGTTPTVTTEVTVLPLLSFTKKEKESLPLKLLFGV